MQLCRGLSTDWDPNESLKKGNDDRPRSSRSLDAPRNPVVDLDLDQVKISRYTSASNAEQHMKSTSIHSIGELQLSLSTLLRSPSTPKQKLLDLSKQIVADTADLFPQSDPHPALARAYNDDGYVNKRLGYYILAVDSYHTSVSLYRESIGKDNASYCSVMNNLAICYKEMADAEPPALPNSAKDGPGDKLGYLARAREAAEECLAIRVDLLRRAVSILGGGGSTMSTTVPDVEDAGRRPPPREPSSVDSTINRMTIDVIQSKAVLGGVLLSQSLAILDGTSFAPVATTGLASGPFLRQPNAGGLVFRNVLTKAEDACRLAVDEAIEHCAGSLLHANVMNSLAMVLKIKGNMAATDDDAEEAYSEARFMYDNALDIRDEKHKSMIHEDVLATKFSIAELLESMGDSKTAKEIKQHVLDSIEGTEIDMGKPMPGRRKQTNDDMVQNLIAEHNTQVLRSQNEKELAENDQPKPTEWKSKDDKRNE